MKEVRHDINRVLVLWLNKGGEAQYWDGVGVGVARAYSLIL